MFYCPGFKSQLGHLRAIVAQLLTHILEMGTPMGAIGMTGPNYAQIRRAWGPEQALSEPHDASYDVGGWGGTGKLSRQRGPRRSSRRQDMGPDLEWG